ncbi:MAG: hypothetical protein ACK5M4_02325 [Pseudorhodobacter sp.]
MTSDPELAMRFRNPGPEFRMAAFWFWHRIPRPEETSRQLADMRAKGIARVMIQARPALPLAEYLSPAYMDAYRHAAAEMRRLDLRMTIYDEYGWMSGHGGGRTVSGADHLRERHLFWTSADAATGQTELTISGIGSGLVDFLGQAGRDWIYEDGSARWGDWQPVLATLDGGAALDCPITISSTGPDGCRIRVVHGGNVMPGQRITVFAAARCLTSRLINYLLPEAARRFAETSYAPLLEAADGAADAFFFDHPYAGFYDWWERRGNLRNSLLWDESLLEGQPADAATFLSLLGDDSTDAGIRRAAFLENYGNRLNEAFFGTLLRWTSARGVGLTGHELLPHVGAWGLQQGLKDFDARAMPGLDHFGLDRFRTVTAADSADYAPQLSARLADSVARANGRSRCIVEQYSTGRPNGAPGLAGQWGLTAETFRAQALRTVIFGARQILLHALNVTDGRSGDGLLSARFDFPPAFNFLPWWEDCPDLFVEIARLSEFLETGDPVQGVSLLYPLETIRAEGPDAACGVHFGWWAEELALAGVGYIIVDEGQLPGHLAGKAAGHALVLPAVTALRNIETAGAIAGFHHAGGQVLVSGGPPHRIGQGEGRPFAAICTAQEADDRQDIRNLIAGLPRPACDIQTNGYPIWSALHRLKDGWSVALFNDGATPASVSIHPPDRGMVWENWDAASGTITPMPAGDPTGRLQVTLSAQGLLCLRGRWAGASAVVPVPARNIVAASAAPVVLDSGWSLQIGKDAPRPIEVTQGWEKQGFPEFSGTGIYRLDATLPARAGEFLWELRLPGVHEVVECWLDGVFIGRCLAGMRRFLLPPIKGRIGIELHIRNTAANQYYAETRYWDGVPQPSGLTRPPVLAPMLQVEPDIA